MPPSLSVALKREFMLSVILQEAALVLQAILNTETPTKLICTLPPGVEREVKDIEGQFVGLGFSGVYVGVETELGVLVDLGVVTAMTQGESPHAYFAGGRSKISKAMVAAFAITVAKLVGSPIEDGSGHWMPQDEFSPEELMVAMTTSSSENC